MREWFFERTPREQALIGIALALAVIVGGWLLVVQPALNYRAESKADYERAAALLEDISNAAREIRALGSLGNERAVQSSQPVRTVAVSTARAEDVTLTRLEPMEDGSLTVWLEDVEAPALYGWLLRLYRDHGIAVTKASLSRNSDRPTTRAQVLLSRGSS